MTYLGIPSLRALDNARCTKIYQKWRVGAVLGIPGYVTSITFNSTKIPNNKN